MINFAEFLKKYSTIPNQFIDEFFKILNYNEYNEIFFIDFDKVVKWLGQRKDSTKRTLIDNFVKNVDYTLEKNDKFRGKPKNDILLKQSTFKKLCMISKSKKAKEVREYFLKVEETLVEWISRKNDMLLNDPRYGSVEGVILYDVESYFDSPYKDKVHSGLVVKYKFLRK